jgi:hypothetical protein
LGKNSRPCLCLTISLIADCAEAINADAKTTNTFGGECETRSATHHSEGNSSDVREKIKDLEQRLEQKKTRADTLQNMNSFLTGQVRELATKNMELEVMSMAMSTLMEAVGMSQSRVEEDDPLEQLSQRLFSSMPGNFETSSNQLSDEIWTQVPGGIVLFGNPAATVRGTSDETQHRGTSASVSAAHNTRRSLLRSFRTAIFGGGSERDLENGPMRGDQGRH